MVTAIECVLWQGEDRDSSDDEWDAAYVALDSVAQLGWIHRGAVRSEIGATLVRDVFAAADEMHENAMSQMDGNREVEEEPGGDGASDGEAAASHCREVDMDVFDSMEPEFEGQSASGGSAAGSSGKQ